jgi:hypothetical protein
MWRLAKHMERVREYQDDQISQGEPHDLLGVEMIESYSYKPVGAVDSFWHFM